MTSPSSLLRLSGPAAALLFVLAVLGFGAGLDGYAQASHPVACWAHTACRTRWPSICWASYCRACWRW